MSLPDHDQPEEDGLTLSASFPEGATVGGSFSYPEIERDSWGKPLPPLPYTATGLPDGLRINANIGRLSGDVMAAPGDGAGPTITVSFSRLPPEGGTASGPATPPVA